MGVCKRACTLVYRFVGSIQSVAAKDTGERTVSGAEPTYPSLWGITLFWLPSGAAIWATSKRVVSGWLSAKEQWSAGCESIVRTTIPHASSERSLLIGAMMSSESVPTCRRQPGRMCVCVCMCVGRRAEES